MRSCRKNTGPRETTLMYRAIASITGTITGNPTTITTASSTRFHNGILPSADKKSADTKSTIFNSINRALPNPGELGQGFIVLGPYRQEVFGTIAYPFMVSPKGQGFSSTLCRS